jgi:LmbE family N-acetylglucosaminyl deacetylase
MPRMLVVVAHPDDETFGTGSCIAFAAASGVDVTVCCATRGEAGEDTSGTTRSPDELARVREAELRAAAEILGAGEVVVLDFVDSDMEGDPAAGSLMAAPIGEIVAAVAPVIARVQPDVVVTLDPDSVVDHRDHVRIGQATKHAFAEAAQAHARLYHWTLVRSVMGRWLQEMHAQGLLQAYDADVILGRPDDEITTVVDVSSVIETRQAGIAAHYTQMSPFHGLEPEFQAAILSADHFVRAVPEWNGGPQETSLWG